MTRVWRAHCRHQISGEEEEDVVSSPSIRLTNPQLRVPMGLEKALPVPRFCKEFSVWTAGLTVASDQSKVGQEQRLLLDRG